MPDPFAYDKNVQDLARAFGVDMDKALEAREAPYQAYASYAAALAGVKPASLQTVSAVVDGRVIKWRRDATGPCLGGGWSPAPDADGYVSLSHFGVVYGDRGSASANTAAINAADEWCAANGKKLSLGDGVIFFDGTLYKNADWIGAGRGYWAPQDAATLPVYDEARETAPTQLVATGTFDRVHRLYGVSSMEAGGAVRVNGSPQGAGYNDTEYRMLSFMDPATGLAKGVSIAIIQQGDGLASYGFRVIPDFGGDAGLDGYCDEAEDGRSTADVDIGFWHDGRRGPSFEEMDIVGHWRMAGFLFCHISLDLDYLPSPYHATFNRCRFQGYKGFAARGSDSYQITAVGSDYVEVPWADDIAIRDPAVWGKVRYREELGNYTATNFGEDIVSVTQVGSAARITFAGPISGVSVGYHVIPNSYGGGNSHLHMNDCAFGGFTFPNGYMAHDGNGVADPFPNPSTLFELGGYRSVETILTRPAFQSIEEVFVHVHDHRFLTFSDALFESNGAADGSKGARFITTSQEGDGSGSTRDVFVKSEFAMTQQYVDFRPAIPLGPPRFSSDAGLNTGARIVFPDYPPLGNINRITGVTGAVDYEVSFPNQVQITVADDTAVTIHLDKIAFNAGMGVYGNTVNAQSGMYAIRAATSLNWCRLLGGTGFAAVLDDTVLDGTTGTDGWMTVSSGQNEIYIENRTGAQRVYLVKLTF